MERDKISSAVLPPLHQGHYTSSDDFDEPDASVSSRSSGIDSSKASLSEYRYGTKKRKRADASDLDSDTNEQKRLKKRKQTKKRHGMKNKRSDSVAGSVSGTVSCTSKGEISSKTKRNHKRQCSSSMSVKGEERIQHRVRSVVVKPHGSCEEANQPTRTYYNQTQYERSVSPEQYEELRSLKEEYERRSREQEGRYHQMDDARSFNRYNQHKERGNHKRRELEDRRDYREARGPPDNCRLREREFPDRKEMYHKESFSSERSRVVHREKPHHRERPRSRCQEERNRRPEGPLSTKERYRDGRGDERSERCDRPDERNVRRKRSLIKTEPRSRDCMSRFADADENKDYDWGNGDVKTEDGKEPAEKEKPNFGLSGKLTADDDDMVNGVVIKYTEPDDAKLPKRRWRLYPFKGKEALPTLYIHRQSAFLIGRDKKVVDIALGHPSISKQHAALQYRATPFTRPDGTQARRVQPYVIDLDSANGTLVNHKKVEPRRYVELLEQDVMKFGFSQREYVLLHENSTDDAQNDEHQEPPAMGGSVTNTEQLRHEKCVKQEITEGGD